MHGLKSDRLSSTNDQLTETAEKHQGRKNFATSPLPRRGNFVTLVFRLLGGMASYCDG